MDWQVRRYKNEAIELSNKLSRIEPEYNELKGALQKILTILNASSDANLTYDDFKFYLLKAVDSNKEIIHDQFETLFMTAIMVFGEELQEIKNEELRKQREYEEQYKRSREKLEKEKSHYNAMVLRRSKEKNQCIKKREDILKKISSGRYKIDDFDDDDQHDLNILIKTKHVGHSIIFNRLIVKKFTDIPVDHDDDYYNCTDHPYYMTIKRRAYKMQHGFYWGDVLY